MQFHLLLKHCAICIRIPIMPRTVAFARPEPRMWLKKSEFDRFMEQFGFSWWDCWNAWWILASKAFDDGALYWDASGKPWSKRGMAIYVDCDAFYFLLEEHYKRGYTMTEIIHILSERDFKVVYPDEFSPDIPSMW